MILTADQYIELIDQCTFVETENSEPYYSKEYYQLSDRIDVLNHAQRIDLRCELVKRGVQKLMPNLTYDYDRQEWIGLDAESKLIWVRP